VVIKNYLNSLKLAHFMLMIQTGKGQKVENQNVESQKEHQKFEKYQNVKSLIYLIFKF
jgi:quinol-cytochrome oxidoreductase complex cytochrome b subunit